MKYIDIHSHILYDVDDGSKDLETSIKYLNELKEMGMNKVVCTPHVRHGDDTKRERILANFEILKKEAYKLGINLYLGNEIMYSSKVIELLKSGKMKTINNSKYVLVEFKRYENMDEENVVSFLESLLEEGYTPILAHVELYRHYRNNKLVDVVSSDSHCTTKRNFKSMEKAYKIVKRKYGNYADIIFHDNPLEIVGEIDEEN